MDDNEQISGEHPEATTTEEPESWGESWSPSNAPQVSTGNEVVNYYFPVEVIVAGRLTPEQVKELREELLQEFSDSINRRLP